MEAELMEQIAAHARETMEKEIRALLEHFGIDPDNMDEYDGPPFELKTHDDISGRHFYVNDVLALTLRTEFTGEHFGEYKATVKFIRYYDR